MPKDIIIIPQKGTFGNYRDKRIFNDISFVKGIVGEKELLSELGGSGQGGWIGKLEFFGELGCG